MKSVKGLVAKVLSVGLLAGAVAMMAPVKAEAQQVYVQGGYGYGYVQDGYGYAQQGYYDRERAEEYRRQEDFARRQAWLREQEWRREQHGRWEHRSFDRDDRSGYDRNRWDGGRRDDDR